MEELGLLNGVRQKMKKWDSPTEINSPEAVIVPTPATRIDDPTERLLASRRVRAVSATSTGGTPTSGLDREFKSFEEEPSISKDANRLLWFRERKEKLNTEPTLTSRSSEMWVVKNEE